MKQIEAANLQSTFIVKQNKKLGKKIKINYINKHQHDMYISLSVKMDFENGSKIYNKL